MILLAMAVLLGYPALGVLYLLITFPIQVRIIRWSRENLESWQTEPFWASIVGYAAIMALFWPLGLFHAISLGYNSDRWISHLEVQKKLGELE